MRKTFFLLLCSTLLYGMSQAQVAPTDESQVAFVTAEIKSALVTKLKLSDASADKVVAIEKVYAEKVVAIKLLNETPLREKQKMREAQMERRSQLSSVPLKPRQMEEVIMIVENGRQKTSSK